MFFIIILLFFHLRSLHFQLPFSFPYPNVTNKISHGPKPIHFLPLFIPCDPNPPTNYPSQCLLAINSRWTPLGDLKPKHLFEILRCLHSPSARQCLSRTRGPPGYSTLIVPAHIVCNPWDICFSFPAPTIIRKCVKTKINLLEPTENEFNIAKPNSLHKTNKFSLGPNKLAHNQQILGWN